MGIGKACAEQFAALPGGLQTVQHIPYQFPFNTRPSGVYYYYYY
jgi:hypothetical protein